ncbi:MAG: DUF1570 domain-containing protein [Planctomycetaceae bacterium]|nr:DUF1570 domain-containing protein [Planctomycetaceae bacterium]
MSFSDSHKDLTRSRAALDFGRMRTPGLGYTRAATAIVMVVAAACRAAAADNGLIRVGDGRSSHVGKIVGLTRTTCSLMDRQGRIEHLSVRDLTEFEKVSPRYTPDSASAFRNALQKEFARGYEVSGTSHYLVCAPRGRAQQYGRLFESIYGDVEQFYRVRGFRVESPEVPLVAVVFSSQEEFVQYCLRDRVTPSPTLRGYYSLLSNRVALYDDAALVSDAGSSTARPAAGHAGDRTILANISGDAADTIIHETTHQVGYNIGIHSRLGGTPVWVVEGLATVLEPDGMRSKSGRRLLSDRLNQERIVWFRERHRPGRPMGNLACIVASDDYFQRNLLNSYSEAWAFLFFLMESPARQRELVSYLQRLRDRDPLKEYTPEERLSDFQSVFGDVSRLEVDFIRYMDRL